MRHADGQLCSINCCSVSPTYLLVPFSFANDLLNRVLSGGCILMEFLYAAICYTGCAVLSNDVLRNQNLRRSSSQELEEI